MTPEEAASRARIGARIRELRQAKGLAARELAAAAGCSRVHISNIEAGRSRATYDTRLAIAEALGIGVIELEMAS